MGSFQAAALDGDSQRILLPFGLGADHWTGLSPPQTWKHFGGRRGRAGNKLQALVCDILPSFLLEERAGKRGLESGQGTLMSQPLALSVLNYPSLCLQRSPQRPVLRTKWFIPNRFPIPQLLLSVGDSLSSTRSLAVAGFR